MFVRTRLRKLKHGTSSYAYLVDNQWNAVRKKHEQKIIACLGPTDTLPHDGTIEKMIIALDNFARKQGFSPLSRGTVIPEIEEGNNLTSCYDWGIINLTKQAMKNLSLDKIISGSQDKVSKKEISADKFAAAVTALLSHRLIPQDDISERATHTWYQNHVFLPDKCELSKDDFYRSLDILIEGKDRIEKSYYEQNLNLFNGKLDLVLFDTTSVYYFGAEGPSDEDDLLQYGFSKDGKGNLKQLIVGVLMTTEGVPIAHEVFPGNTADVNSFSRIVTILKEKYSIDKVILIADRGMISEDNLVHMEQSGLSYIIGIRMRTLPQSLKRRLLIPLDEEEELYELEFMDKSSDNLYTKEFPVSKFTDDEINDLFIEKIKKGKSATFNQDVLLEQIKKRRFFVCLNPFVKAKKKKDRQFFTRIIEKKIATTPIKDFIIKNGYRKYLKFDKGLSPSIDYDRLRDEEVYDGKWIIMTNENISSFMAGSYYKTLQTIERGFKDLKSLMAIRPIYHFKEQRIKAHIFTCFLSLVVKWYICRILNQYSQEDGKRFIEKMNNLKAIDADRQLNIFVRTDIDQETQTNMKKLSMKIPGKVIFSPLKQPAPITHKGGRLRKNQPILPGISFTI